MKILKQGAATKGRNIGRAPVQSRGSGNERTKPVRWTIWILAGGKSSRMGRDKARIVIAGKPLLRHVRASAAATGLPVRIIRQDAIPSCGPLSGIFTGLQRARSGWCLFLPCDMPLITPRLLGEVMKRVEASGRPVFLRTARGFGFPLALPTSALANVLRVIDSGVPSLQRLAKQLRVVGLELPASRQHELLNANLPADLIRLRTSLAARGE